MQDGPPPLGALLILPSGTAILRSPAQEREAMPHERIDLSKIKTCPLGQRLNLVKLSDLVRPCDPPPGRSR